MMKKLLCSLLFTVIAVGFVNAQSINVTGLGNIIAGDGSNTPAVSDDTEYGSVEVGGTAVDHTFTINNLTTDILIVGLENLTNQIDFSQSASPTPNTVLSGGSSTYSVTFDPTSAGLKSSVVQVNVFNFTTSTTETYFYNIQGTGTVPAAEPIINVLGGGTFITNGDTTPSGTDDTDFGNVDITSGSVTNTYTILNTGTANLTFPANIFFIGSSDFTIISQPTSPITPGNSSTFQITFDPSSTGAISGTVLIQSNDTDENPFTYTIQGNGTDIALEPEIDITGNGISITTGDTSPSLTDDTDFGDVDVAAGAVTNTFTINNIGGADLALTTNVLVVGSADFSVSLQPSSPVSAGGSSAFIISYDPSTTGSSSATVIVQSNDGDENPYTFSIQGNGITVGVGSPLMITQYYEGTSSINNWIEVKNISASATIAGSYSLALFLNSNATIAGGITSNNPDEVVSIPSLAPGEVIIFSRASATLPIPANRGSATVIETEVCTFTGNDVVLISTSSENNTYNDRIDIVGVVGNNSAVNWGTDIAIIKGCGTTEAPSTTYNPFEYIVLTLDEVREADPNTNIALGTQTVGPTTWTSSWSNGLPDKTKETIINGTYNNTDGSFESCDLTISPGSSINLDSGGSGSNYVLVDQNLTINGSFTIGDTESLIMTDPDAVISGSISKIERTTPLNNFRDYTYWSSPVNTTVASAFTGVDPNRIWLWRTPSGGDTGNFEIASGAMIEGRGYIAEAPSSVTSGQQHQVTFTGTPNNGLVDVTVGIDLTNGDGYGGYNIIGNPYPSAIDIDEFLKDQANVELNNANVTTTDATIWLWTHGTQIDGGTTGEFTAADYATYNLVGGVGSGNDEGTGLTPTNIIGSGQGFLIRVLTPGNNEITFENSMRVIGQNDTQFFKSNKSTTKKDRMWLNMTSEDGVSNKTLIGFMDDATDGFDRGYDGLSLTSGNVILYSMIEDDIYAIQGFGGFDQAREIPLGFYAALENKHKISIDKFEGVLEDEEIYLVDNELNIIHDLKQGAYEFDVLTAGNYKERFTLKFNSGVLSTDDLTLNNSFIVFSENGTLKVKAGEEISKLKVYDITGRLLIDSEPKSAAFNLESQSIKAGTVLILNATMKNGSTISKKAIKY